MASVLIVDDDKTFGEMLRKMVKTLGHEGTCALTIKDGIRAIVSGRFDVVLLDVQMPDGSGLDILPEIKEIPSSPEVIIMTGSGDPDGAELAIMNGAWDYIEKQSSLTRLSLALTRALQYRQEKAAKKSPVALKLEGIVGKSPSMRACYDLLAQAADSEANVLITGETGTGKELFAKAIHANGQRASKAFVVVDCAALPASLVESALFGHEKGSFTGADRAQIGLIKQADGGTLFLDEVGELPLVIQKAFLRVLQERSFRPIGGRHEVTSDFRLVAATNRNLDEMVAKGEFREDLLFRLRSFIIELPPLRQRLKDIKNLALFHTSRLCERYKIGPKGFAPEFLEALTAYSWPGNVRELVNALDQALTVARHEPTLFPKHLPFKVRVEVVRAAIIKANQNGDDSKEGTISDGRLPDLQEFRQKAIDEAEKQYLRELMPLAKGNVKEACRLAKLSKSRLYGLLKKYNIS